MIKEKFKTNGKNKLFEKTLVFFFLEVINILTSDSWREQERGRLLDEGEELQWSLEMNCQEGPKLDVCQRGPAKGK